MALITTLALAGIAAGLAGAGVSAAGAEASASAQSKAASFNAAVAQNQALASGQQSRFNAQQIQLQNQRRVNLQRSAMAASGFDVNSGSFSDVTRDTQQQGEMQRLLSLYQGKISANYYGSQSQLNQAQAASASQAGSFGAASSLLTGAASAGSQASRLYYNSVNPQFN